MLYLVVQATLKLNNVELSHYAPLTLLQNEIITWIEEGDRDEARELTQQSGRHKSIVRVYLETLLVPPCRKVTQAIKLHAQMTTSLENGH